MADRNQEGLNNIITAINNIVDPKISNSKFDRTFRAKVIEQTEDEDYIIQVNNINYTLKYAGKLEPNQIVMVKAPLNNFSDIYIESVLGTGGGTGGTDNYDDLTNKPILKTDISEGLNPDDKELIKGTIELHKISKTGDYGDLNNKPELNFIPETEKASSNGVATLDSNKKVTNSQLPIATVETLGAVKAGANIIIADDGTISAIGGAGGTVSDTLPIGSTVEWYSEVIPENWLLCNGQAISRTEYAELFAFLGTEFGDGDGSTTFNLPDKREKFSLGKGEEEPYNQLGNTGGEEQHTLTLSEIPSHGHSSAVVNPNSAEFTAEDVGYTYTTSNNGVVIPLSNTITRDTKGFISSTMENPQGGGESHNNMPPYIVVNYIIKAKQTVATVATIIDNLNSTSAEDGLSANMGRQLNEDLKNTNSNINSLETNLTNLNTKVDGLSTLEDLQAGDNVTITKSGSVYKISSQYPGTASKTALGLVKIGDNINVSDDGTISVALGTINYNDLENKPILNTNNSTAQTVNPSEEISGTINLHKVSKTGSYSDLLNKPSLDFIPTSQKGAANGVATLDSNKKVTNSELPSDLVYDSSYVHTDNNFTTTLKNKLDGIENDAQVNKIEKIQRNGTELAITNKTVNVEVPTNNNQLINGAGYITSSGSITGNAATSTYAGSLQPCAIVGSDVANTSGWYKIASSTMKGFGNTNITYLIRAGYQNGFVGILEFEMRSDYTRISCWKCQWLTRMGFSAGDVIIVIDNMTWTMYARNPTPQHGRLYFIELQHRNINGSKPGYKVTYYNSSTPESSKPTATVTSSDGGICNYANSAEKATKDASGNAITTTYYKASNPNGYITNAVNSLTNYYLKTETYTKTEVNNLIGQIKTVSIEVVDELPTTGETNKIYFVPKTGEVGDTYNEYIWINNAWELIGSTQVDLTGYATEDWVNGKIADFVTDAQVTQIVNNALSNYYTQTQVNNLLSVKANISDIPTKVSELENDSGFTSNAGTVTSVAVRMNGQTKGTVTSSGTIDLGTVITSHQSLDGYAKTADLATVATTGDYNDLENKPTIPAAITVDSTLSSTSTNPVQNKVINTALNDKQGKLTAGANITISDSTISAKDTTYEVATTSVNGLMSSSDKTKLNGIASGAEVNVQSDWSVTDTASDSYIKNKPTIPTVNNGILTIQKNGTNVQTFTANQSANVTANIEVPIKTSELTNDSNFTTTSDVEKITGGFLKNPTYKNGTLSFQRPNLPTVNLDLEIPTKVSELDNDSKFLTISDIPTASSTVSGTIKVGSTLKIENGILDIAQSGFNVVDNLNSTSALDALSANQGRILDTKVSVSSAPPDTSNVAKLWVDTSGENLDLLYNNSESGDWESLLPLSQESSLIDITSQCSFVNCTLIGGKIYVDKVKKIVYIQVQIDITTTSAWGNVIYIPSDYKIQATIPAQGGAAITATSFWGYNTTNNVQIRGAITAGTNIGISGYYLMER